MLSTTSLRPPLRSQLQKTTMILDPHKKAWLVTVMLVVLGVASWINHVNDYEIAIPLFLFYAVLIINTHFSIILFSSLVSQKNKVQTALDLILFALYVILSTFSSPERRIFRLFWPFFPIFLATLSLPKKSTNADNFDNKMADSARRPPWYCHKQRNDS